MLLYINCTQIEFHEKEDKITEKGLLEQNYEHAHESLIDLKKKNKLLKACDHRVLEERFKLQATVFDLKKRSM